jgi:hypothetical protein
VPNGALQSASDDLQKRFDRVFIRLLVQRLMDTTAKVGSWGMETLGVALGPEGARRTGGA